MVNPQYEIEYSDEQVTAWGGMRLMKEVLERSGVSRHLSEAPLPEPGSNRGYSPLVMVGSFLVNVWMGCCRMSHTEGMGPSHDVIAWAPRVKGDTIKSAGYRLVHVFMLEILMVKDGEWHCDPDFAGGIICSMEIEWIMGAIAFSQQNSKKELKQNLELMPTYLREDYRKLARIVPKGTPWPESSCWG